MEELVPLKKKREKKHKICSAYIYLHDMDVATVVSTQKQNTYCPLTLHNMSYTTHSIAVSILLLLWESQRHASVPMSIPCIAVYLVFHFEFLYLAVYVTCRSLQKRFAIRSILFDGLAGGKP